MAIKEGDAKNLAEIIGQFVDNRNDKTINRTYKRGIVDKATKNTADVFVEGSTVATKNVLALDSYAPVKGDKVLIVSIGDTGANLIILGSISGKREWITPAYQNSWTRYEASWNQAGYYRDSAGVVHLKGMVKDGAMNQAIFTLPEGFRPANRMLIGTHSSPGVGRVDVGSDGRVIPVIGNNSWFTLDGISFLANM